MHNLLFGQKSHEESVLQLVQLICIRSHSRNQCRGIALLCPFCKYAYVKFVTLSHWQHSIQFQGHAPCIQSHNPRACSFWSVIQHLTFFFFFSSLKVFGNCCLLHVQHEKKYSVKKDKVYKRKLIQADRYQLKFYSRCTGKR